MTTAYVAAPPEAAADLARTLVEERLAAAVNRIECESVYRWDGEIREEPEEILLAKTTADRFPALRDRVAELHPYEAPCVERFEDDGALPAFVAWRDRAATPDGADATSDAETEDPADTDDATPDDEDAAGDE